MALTLRDSHSYETQIIDAVRSVNRALGGTYGTSSAIHKSEFNQYEVQLIDAIKGIGRTLSGDGLSLAGGGASSKELQDLAKRVTKLESESFFRLVNGNVTLKEAYSNLWVPGWLAAGGVGTTGTGGASLLRQLEDVYHDSTGILRANGDPVDEGDVLVYDSTAEIWVAGQVSGTGTVTNYGSSSTGHIATIGSTYIYNDVAWGSAGQTANTFTLTVNGVTKTVALEGYGGGGGGGAYTLGTATAAAAAKGTMLGVNAISNDLSSTGSESSLIEWDSTNSAWHFLGNIYSDGWIAAGGTGTPGSGGSGIDLAAMWASLTNSVADAYASTKINVAHIPNLTVSMITDWANVYTLRTPVSTTAANGVLLGVDALSNASSSVSGSDNTRIEWDSNNNAWRVRGNLYADGWVAAGGIGSGGGGANSLSGLSDVNDNLSPAAKNVLWYDSTNSIWDAHALTYSDISDLPTANETGFLKYYAGNHSWVLSDAVTTVEWDTEGITTTGWTTIGYLKVYDSGTHSYTVKAPSGGGGGSTVSWGTVYSDYTAQLTVNGTTKIVCLDGYDSGGGGGGATSLNGLSDVTISSPTSGQVLKYNGSYWVNGSAGGSSATSLSDLSDVSFSGLTNGQALVWDSANAVWKNATVGGGGGSTGYIGTTQVQSVSLSQALTGILSINATSSSSSASRIVWENNAWHFYGNIYADGYIAAGGNA